MREKKTINVQNLRLVALHILIFGVPQLLSFLIVLKLI